MSLFRASLRRSTFLRASILSSKAPTSLLLTRQLQLPRTVEEQLTEKGIKPFPLTEVVYQPTVPELYEFATDPAFPAIRAKQGCISASGAMVAFSGEKTGRTPKEKRIVAGDEHEKNIWWGDVNIPLSPTSWSLNRDRGVQFINSSSRIYIVDGFAGWDPKHRIKIRIVCTRPYHALFMHNMLIRPTKDQLKEFEQGQPDFTVFNAGEFPADPQVPGLTSDVSVALNLGKGEVCILGTQYAGEMKKGVFSLMHYLMPQKDVLSLHSSATEGPGGDVTLFFGLSGTGKTTLSADPHRSLIGDDEHCWSPDGVFNIEGGCYAKADGLSHAAEPEIYEAVRYGSVLENVVLDPDTRKVDFNDLSITKNTRLCYPLEYMPTAKAVATGGHPKNIIFLTCDAFGVLPPVSKLSPEQAMYHFINGYTAKVAGTEVGVSEPSATFSACFGEAFLLLHPTQYADLLAKKMAEHDTHCWLVNTGWSGGAYGTGKRMSLKVTRALIDGIHSGELATAPSRTLPVFNLEVPTECTGVDSAVLYPPNVWADAAEYDKTLRKLGGMFQQSFKKYEDKASAKVLAAGPQLD